MQIECYMCNYRFRKRVQQKDFMLHKTLNSWSFSKPVKFSKARAQLPLEPIQSGLLIWSEVKCPLLQCQPRVHVVVAKKVSFPYDSMPYFLHRTHSMLGVYTRTLVDNHAYHGDLKYAYITAKPCSPHYYAYIPARPWGTWRCTFTQSSRGMNWYHNACLFIQIGKEELHMWLAWHIYMHASLS